MRLLTAILALLTGIAGWFYLFYSKAAGRLGGIEQAGANRWRVQLRRANGVVMILLAVLLYSGTYGIDPQAHPRTFILIWMGVIMSLGLILLLVLADVRLTIRLKSKLRRDSAESGGRTNQERNNG